MVQTRKILTNRFTVVQFHKTTNGGHYAETMARAWRIPSHSDIWIFMLLGLLKVDGYWKLWREVYRGNHIIAANHPTLL